MVDTMTLLFTLLILFNIVFFMLGFLVGKNFSSQPVFGSQHNGINRPNNSFNKITIDESKVVTDINLAGLEKKYETLGETKTSHETINSSVDKLKNLKR